MAISQQTAELLVIVVLILVEVLSAVVQDAAAEKQRVSCACLSSLANWSCNAENTAESQLYNSTIV